MLDHWTRDDWLTHFGEATSKGHPPDNKAGKEFYKKCSKRLSNDSKDNMKDAYYEITGEVFPE